MEPRLSQILEAAVKGFIETGEPVSSDWLYEHYDFGIRPARIRTELQELTDHGYLEQPHHSSGRMPSDRGYEFFTDLLLGRNEANTEETFTSLTRLFRRSAWPDFLEDLSEEMGILGIAEDITHQEVYKKGLDELIEKLDWSSPSEIKDVIRDFEALDERLAHLKKAVPHNSVMVFIGKKSPITQSDQLAVVAAEYRDDNGTVLLAAIGPKRMDYESVIQLFKKL